MKRYFVEILKIERSLNWSFYCTLQYSQNKPLFKIFLYRNEIFTAILVMLRNEKFSDLQQQSDQNQQI